MSIFEKILQKFCIRLQLLTIFFHFSPLQDLIFQFQFLFVNNNQYEIIAKFIIYITLFISLKNSKPNLRYLIFSTKGHFEFCNMAHADPETAVSGRNFLILFQILVIKCDNRQYQSNFPCVQIKIQILINKIILQTFFECPQQCLIFLIMSLCYSIITY